MAVTLRLSVADGATVQGVVNLTATADSPMSKVRFYLDGVQVSEDVGFPWRWSWDTRAGTDASHTVTVHAIRHGRVTAKRSITVTVDNVAPGGPSTTNASFNLTGAGILSFAPTITQGTIDEVFPGASIFPSDNAPTAVTSRSLIVYQAELEVPAVTSDRSMIVYQAELEIPA